MRSTNIAVTVSRACASICLACGESVLGGFANVATRRDISRTSSLLKSSLLTVVPFTRKAKGDIVGVGVNVAVGVEDGVGVWLGVEVRVGVAV